MSDLIKREDVIEAVKHSTAYMHDDLYEAISRIPSAETTGALDDAIAKYVADGLMELPSAEANWIPCSERLPKVGDDVLFCDSEWTEEGCLRADGDWWQFRWSTVMPKEKVTAWMPLPKPYKGGEK